VSASAARLLGLDGFEVLAAQVAAGEWQLEIQTTATLVGCIGCGMRAELHGRRTVRVRDLPIGGRPVVLAWRKRIWRCGEPACKARTWTEQTAAIRPRVVLTQRARADACRRVGKDATRSPRWLVTSALAGEPSCGRWLTTAVPWSATPRA
jgi:transposase